jgi:hypothetical protein
VSPAAWANALPRPHWEQLANPEAWHAQDCPECGGAGTGCVECLGWGTLYLPPREEA